MDTHNPRSVLKIALVTVALLGLLMYTYIQTRSLIAGPFLTITSPQNGQTIASSSPEVVVRGTSKNISFLTINGLQIYTDEQGAFQRKLLLAPGYNIITVEAQGRFNRSVIKQLQLFVK